MSRGDGRTGRKGGMGVERTKGRDETQD
jgi:hypothetical protein